MTSLWSFLALYKWSVLAGAITAPVLSFMGAQLASRDQAIQTLCIGQGATLGVLVTLAVITPFDTEGGFLRDCGIPLMGSLLFCGLSFWITQWLTEKKQSSKATYFVIFFAALSASGYLVCALVPALENHMTQMFFGDLATLSNLEAFLAMAFSLMAMTR